LKIPNTMNKAPVPNHNGFFKTLEEADYYANWPSWFTDQLRSYLSDDYPIMAVFDQRVQSAIINPYTTRFGKKNRIIHIPPSGAILELPKKTFLRDHFLKYQDWQKEGYLVDFWYEEAGGKHTMIFCIDMVDAVYIRRMQTAKMSDHLGPNEFIKYRDGKHSCELPNQRKKQEDFQELGRLYAECLQLSVQVLAIAKRDNLCPAESIRTREWPLCKKLEAIVYLSTRPEDFVSLVSMNETIKIMKQFIQIHA